jgi:hypothetical protein
MCIERQLTREMGVKMELKQAATVYPLLRPAASDNFSSLKTRNFGFYSTSNVRGGWPPLLEIGNIVG